MKAPRPAPLDGSRRALGWGRPAALVLLLVVLGLVVASCGGSGSSGQTGQERGIAAPDFSGATLEGLDVSLSQYRGKPLVLAFMASW